MNQLQESQLHQDVSPILGGASERPENIALLFDALPPFPRIFSFNGRIGRGAFFLIQIFLLLMLGAAVATYDGILSYGVQELLTIATPLVHGYANRELVSTFDLIGGGDELRIALAVLCFIAWYILGLSASVRRFHDFGYSGWTLVPLGLLSAIPYIGWLFGLMPYFVPGDEGPNQYGDPPQSSHFLARVRRLPRHIWRGETPLPNMLFVYVFFFNFLVLDKVGTTLMAGLGLSTINLLFVAALIMLNCVLAISVWRSATISDMSAPWRVFGRLIAVILAARVAFTFASFLVVNII